MEQSNVPRLFNLLQPPAQWTLNASSAHSMPVLALASFSSSSTSTSHGMAAACVSLLTVSFPFLKLKTKEQLHGTEQQEE